MKKLLKVKIKRSQENGKTSYTYPKEFEATKFQVLVYETQLEGKLSHVVGRGNKDEYVLGFVDEQFVSDFLKNPDIKIIDRSEARNFLAEDYEKSIEKVNDQNKVLTILAKSVRGESLSSLELAALDPNNPEKGIIRTKTFKEVLDENDI